MNDNNDNLSIQSLTDEEIKKNQVPKEMWVKITDNIIKDINPYYWISNYGNVYSEFDDNYMYQGSDDKGYMYVWLTCKAKRVVVLVHRLEMLAFNYITGCENLEVNHKDGYKNHNWLWNLEWNTRLENIHHAINTGLANMTGENNGMAVITDEQAHIICRGIRDNLSIEEIEYLVGNHSSSNFYRLVYNIKSRRKWTHISKDYEFPETKYRLFSDEQVIKIRKYLEQNMTCREVLTALGLDTNNMDIKTFNNYKSVISGIKCGKFYNSKI